MNLQDRIHKITEGSTATLIRSIGVALGFIGLALLYNMHNQQSFPAQEAMDTAQVARNLADGKGYTTFSIRPLALTLLREHSPKAVESFSEKPMPEVSNPPVYPALLAAFFKALPYPLSPKGPNLASRQLESWITALNQALFFAAILLVFFLGRLLFDHSVAWVSAGIFAATELYWRLSASGLSTMLLIVIFLAMALCLVQMERQEKGGSALALATGVLLALGGLTAYSFAWLVVPVVFFLYFGVQQRRKLCFAVVLPFLVLTIPWLARNYALTGNCYGTAGYAVYQDTSIFPADTLERSLNLQNGLTRLNPRDITDKFATNIHGLLQNEVPKFGGNWVSAFFLVGLLIPFRKEALSKIRLFLLGSLALFLCLQALGQTHLTTDSPEINSENLLVVLAPLAFLFGTGLFFTLIDQLQDLTPQMIRICTGLFLISVCAPFILFFLSPPVYPEANPLDSLSIQWVSRWSNDKDLMMSDVPSAMAWYGRRPCAWLTLDDGEEFSKFRALEPVHSLYLTQRTTDHLLSQSAQKKHSWEGFALDFWANREVPDGFPLTKAPTVFRLDRIFISDREMWRRGQ